jgi:hypothetical protein
VSLAEKGLILVTGCGRSGTKYTAELLQRVGLDVLHEKMGADGIATWCMAVDSCDSPWGGGRHDLKFKTILHQVRHPLKVIPSLTTFTARSWQFIERYVPCPQSDPVILRAAKYWYYWNLEAEKIASWRYRIEALPQIFDEFCRRLGVEPRREALAQTSTMTNSRKTRPEFQFLRQLLDRLHLGQSSTALEFIYDPQWGYLDGVEFTWDVLEGHAPGWSQRIRETATRYGYVAADDNGAARFASAMLEDVQGRAVQPR